MEARRARRHVRRVRARQPKEAQSDEEHVKELHAKIGKRAVANSFLERKLKPWGGK